MKKDDVASRISRLKDSFENAKRERDIAEGKLQQLMETLKKDFGVTSIKEAVLLLSKKSSELEAKEKELNKVLDAIEDEFVW